MCQIFAFCFWVSNQSVHAPNQCETVLHNWYCNRISVGLMYFLCCDSHRWLVLLQETYWWLQIWPLYLYHWRLLLQHGNIPDMYYHSSFESFLNFSLSTQLTLFSHWTHYYIPSMDKLDSPALFLVLRLVVVLFTAFDKQKIECCIWYSPYYGM